MLQSLVEGALGWTGSTGAVAKSGAVEVQGADGTSSGADGWLWSVWSVFERERG